ncbi:MAG: UDP-4-amino-4,6-dideoxy-N-acetyl-beta-L-altrosamine transaminase [Bacillota bacterium]
MRFIPYGWQAIDEEDIRSVVEVLRSDRLTQGPKVAEFEEALAAYCGARYAVVFSSGTAALHGAYFATRVQPGSEVITSPITFAATANAALYLGAKPVFADIEPDTANIDVTRIENLINKRTRAIAPVHFAGQPCDIDEIHQIARRHGLYVIEDACHALGATYKGQRIGSLSDMTVFSFHPVKHIATGEGGAVLTDNPDFVHKLRMFREHGITRDAALPGSTNPETEPDPWYYEMQHLGYNYRLTDIQCALGISQLKKLDGFLERRREIARTYDRAFAEVPAIRPPAQKPDRESAYHIYVVQIDWKAIGRTRREVCALLRQNGIGTQVHYLPVYSHPYYRSLGYPPGLCPRAEAYYEAALTLPLFPAMTDEEVQRVIKAVGRLATGTR